MCLILRAAAARANAKKAALTVTERKDAKAAGVTFDDPEENCAALIVNPSAGTLVTVSHRICVLRDPSARICASFLKREDEHRELRRSWSLFSLSLFIPFCSPVH